MKELASQNKPTSQQEKQVKLADHYKKIDSKLKGSTSELQLKQLNGDTLESLINAMLASSVKRMGKEIQVTTDEEMFDWPAIIEFCEKSGKFKDDAIKTMKDFKQGIGISTELLINASNKNKEIRANINDLKEKMKTYYEAKADWDEIENSDGDITLDSIEEAEEVVGE